MFHSKHHFMRELPAFAGAIILALVMVGIPGGTRAQASTLITHGDSTFCAVGLPSRDEYLRQEQAILSKVTQSNWSAAELASPGSSNACAAGEQSNEVYLRQEEAVMRRVAQGSWSVAEMAQPAASLQSREYYLLQEEMVLRKVTQSNWNTAEIASFDDSNFIALASR